MSNNKVWTIIISPWLTFTDYLFFSACFCLYMKYVLLVLNLDTNVFIPLLLTSYLLSGGFCTRSYRAHTQDNCKITSSYQRVSPELNNVDQALLDLFNHHTLFYFNELNNFHESLSDAHGHLQWNFSLQILTYDFYPCFKIHLHLMELLIFCVLRTTQRFLKAAF